MDILFNSTLLSEAASVVSRIISSKHTIKAQGFIMFNAENEAVSITSADDKMSITATIPCDVIEPGSFAVDGRLFSELMKKQPGCETRIRIMNQTTQITSGSSKIRLPAMECKFFPQIVNINENAIYVSVLAKEMKDCIDFVGYAASRDEIRPILTGILFELSSGRLRMVAIDGFRMAIKDIECEYDGQEVRLIVPGKSANEISGILGKITDEKVVFRTDKKRMIVEAGDYKINTSLIAGEYISYANIIPKRSSTKCLVSVRNLSDAIERANVISKVDAKGLIRFSFKRDEIQVSSASDIGNTSEEVECEMNGEEMRISFNIRYIIDAIKRIDDEKVEMDCDGGVRPVIVRDHTRHKTIQVVLPVRTAESGQ